MSCEDFFEIVTLLSPCGGSSFLEDIMSDEDNCQEVILTSSGERIDRLLSAQTGLSRALIQRLLTEGRITHKETGKALTRRDAKTVPMGAYVLHLPPPPSVEAQKESMDLDVVFEDDCLIVLNKPSGLVVHPAPGHYQGTLVNGLLHHTEDLSRLGGVKRPGIVHRLDKDTSGLMVVAKTDEAHHFLSVQLKNHTMGRLYQALVMGLPKPSYGWIDAPMGRHPHHRQQQAIIKDGRPARTFYKTMSLVNQSVAYVICRLETGRTHQIRLHMAHVGSPVLGDPMYGRRTPSKAYKVVMETVWPHPYQALHAGCLFFNHPKTRRRQTFYVPLPAAWSDLDLPDLDGPTCHSIFQESF